MASHEDQTSCEDVRAERLGNKLIKSKCVMWDGLSACGSVGSCEVHLRALRGHLRYLRRPGEVCSLE